MAMDLNLKITGTIGFNPVDLEITGTLDSPGPDPTEPEPEPEPDPEPVSKMSPLGINLSSLSYFKPEFPFVDVFKQANSWTLSPASPAIDEDSDGWVQSLDVGQTAETIMCRKALGNYPSGTYIALYDGDGTIGWFDDAVLDSRTAGRDVLTVTPSDNGFRMRIITTNPADPLRNFRVLMPGHEATYATAPWEPGFISRWEKFQVYRFMDWQAINNSQQADWADRRLTTYFTQGATAAQHPGAALETLIDLCNTTGKDAWFCIPHLATDDYITQFATLVFNTLDTSLKVYVEYTNEVWNGAFAQANYCRDQGLALELHANPSVAQTLFYAQRSRDVHIIFETVYGASATRLVRVYGSQSVSSFRTGNMLDHTYQSKQIREDVDAVAIAPYMGNSLGNPTNGPTTKTLSVAQIISAMSDEIPGIVVKIGDHLGKIGADPIDLIAYEGGQHLVGTGGQQNDTDLTAKLLAVNRDAGMEALYKKYFEAWRDAGGKMFVHYNSTAKHGKNGSWGALEFITDSETNPGKYTAMINYIQENPTTP